MIYVDEQAVPNAATDCLKKELWEKFRTRFSPTDDGEFLLKLRLLTTDAGGRVCPTVSGILLASNSPQDYLPSAYIQAVAYRGAERNAAYQFDARDITGPLDQQIAAAYNFIRKNMRIGAVKKPARRDIPQYSMSAVFEALVNAVAHRDYSIHGAKIRLHLFDDRLELFSPGAIPNTMTIDSLPLRQAMRNELLCSLLARCPVSLDDYDGERGFLMDRRGEGVPIILSASENLSGRRPEYRLLDNAELLLTIHAATPHNEKHSM